MSTGSQPLIGPCRHYQTNQAFLNIQPFVSRELLSVHERIKSLSAKMARAGQTIRAENGLTRWTPFTNNDWQVMRRGAASTATDLSEAIFWTIVGVFMT